MSEKRSKPMLKVGAAKGSTRASRKASTRNVRPVKSSVKDKRSNKDSRNASVKNQENFTDRDADSANHMLLDAEHPEHDEKLQVENSTMYHGIRFADELTVQGDFLLRGKYDEQLKKLRVVVSVLWSGTYKHIMVRKNQKGDWKLNNYSNTSIDSLMDKLVADKILMSSTGTKIIRAIHRQPWLLRHTEVKRESKLGEGVYGEVFLGELTTKKGLVKVAVKQHLQMIESLTREAHIMQGLTHENVVSLHGLCCFHLPVYVVIEYCAKGALSVYLQNNPVSMDERLSHALQVAKAMAYLSSKKIVHRDLAARNVLITSDGTAKVADFGLSRQADASGLFVVGFEAGTMPVRWMAPETVLSSQHKFTFSWATDAWSYGVLLWEISTNAATVPYESLSTAQACTKFSKGEMMPMGETCPIVFKTVAEQCWHLEVTKRPTFADIVHRLSEKGVVDESTTASLDKNKKSDKTKPKSDTSLSSKEIKSNK